MTRREGRAELLAPMRLYTALQWLLFAARRELFVDKAASEDAWRRLWEDAFADIGEAAATRLFALSPSQEALDVPVETIEATLTAEIDERLRAIKNTIVPPDGSRSVTLVPLECDPEDSIVFEDAAIAALDECEVFVRREFPRVADRFAGVAPPPGLKLGRYSAASYHGVLAEVATVLLFAFRGTAAVDPRLGPGRGRTASDWQTWLQQHRAEPNRATPSRWPDLVIHFLESGVDLEQLWAGIVAEHAEVQRRNHAGAAPPAQRARDRATKLLRSSQIRYPTSGDLVPGQTLDNWCHRGLVLEDGGPKVTLEEAGPRIAGERVFLRRDVERFLARAEQYRRARRG
jgi:hypothetical protein